MSIEATLVVHCIAMSVVVASSATLLWRRGLLTVGHSGTWITLGVALYLVYNPLTSLVSGDLSLYSEALGSLSGDGTLRAILILVATISGIFAFLLAYVGGRSRATPSPSFQRGSWSVLQVLVLTGFFGFATYSLLFLRTSGAFVDSSISVEFDDGRIVGGATGYAVVAHSFYLFIIVILLLRGQALARWIGAVLALGIIAVRLFDAHDRASIISLMAAIGIVSFVGKGTESWFGQLGSVNRLVRRLRVAAVLAAAVAMTAFLVARGHSSIADMDRVDWDRSGEALRQNDTAMLPTLYAWSSAYDQYGYDYALPLMGHAMFGYLPRQFFPWKDDFPVIVLGRQDIRYIGTYERWFLGPKATILGSFYGHGGFVGIVLGFWVLGVACRRLDWMVSTSANDLVRALGIVWMAGVWMMFGSGDSWVMSNMFINALPFAGVLIASKISAGLRRSRQPATERVKA